MNFLASLRTLLLALILSIGISYAYATWSDPTGTPPPNNNASAPINISSAPQVKSGALGVDDLFTAYKDVILAKNSGNVGIGTTVSPTEKLEVVGNIKASGNLQAPTVCLSGDCKSAWPVAGGVADWNTMINTPAGFVDNIDNEGPTVTKSPAVYQCPPAPGGCSPISGSTCTGSLSTNPTCTYKDSCSGRGSFTVLGCDFKGYLVQ